MIFFYFSIPASFRARGKIKTKNKDEKIMNITFYHYKNPRLKFLLRETWGFKEINNRYEKNIEISNEKDVSILRHYYKKFTFFLRPDGSFAPWGKGTRYPINLATELSPTAKNFLREADIAADDGFSIKGFKGIKEYGEHMRKKMSRLEYDMVLYMLSSSCVI